MKIISNRHRSAFSLVELIVVSAIVVILAALSVPAFSSIQRANGVSRGGQMLADALISARQEASGRNRDVELRVILSGNPARYQAFQVWISGDDGVLSPLGKIQKLPEGMIIAADGQLSPILSANTDLSGSADFGSFGTCSFAALRIRAGGLPDPSVNESNNFLTVHAATDTNTPPQNYFTIRLDPATGRVNTFRP